ncbi:UNVERIFIED_CONTAM: hypothetical protein Sradi_1582100 [Sesamum radiatum]|uniref:Reverse transcriptase domain-containing protein n=1 Tax=Sesamum radiatum TaxID=300843 RepID=A0AAW2UA84_SESRA
MLTSWSKRMGRGDKKRTDKLEKRLAFILSGTLTRELQEEASAIRKELEAIAAHEETKWRQRSKDLWLKEGDRNTSFFHRRASKRFQHNIIRRIKNSNGVWVADDEGIQGCIQTYFRGVFASGRPRTEDIERGTAQLRRVVDPSMADELTLPYSEAEVTKALFQMASLKSPGPDGSFPQLNLPFVPGRLISDNILLAFEINHFLNTKANSRQGYMELKLDVSKAYDKVEWAFLEQVLFKLGFPLPFIRLVMLCVSSVSYSFLLGGKHFGSLTLERGLRQGDPLSPYLFLLFTEAFSSLLQKAETEGRLCGIPVCRGAPSISHLLFADDTLIFSEASGESVHTILEVLELYRRASGQEINFSKSSVAFSKNMSETECQAITNDLHIRRENKMALYLGLPSVVARSKRELFAVIRDKIWSRING